MIRYSNRQTAHLLEQGWSLDHCKDQCARGLEHRTHQRFQERRSNRRSAFGAVMEEQNRQFKESMVDEETISAVYHSCVLCCQEEALERGLAS